MDQKKKPIVICAFPGAYDDKVPLTINKKNIKIIELNMYHFPKNDYPRNYVEAFMKLYESGDYDYIICTVYKSFRDELKKLNIEYVILKPHLEDKEVYIRRLFIKNYPINVIKSISDGWSNYIDELHHDDALRVLLQPSETITDLLNYMW